ncbi:uncharacterized protein TrAtP1_004486 [Trichoderma atroviride]|uniref:uncharacterized protein n=1 Tax=Hypocrea atroviridis TaxID=63577 RepID=UPI0033165C68|nr:hypothetical protein TrAtP1_004486 [Trichoderma atroviride]
MRSAAPLWGLLQLSQLCFGAASARPSTNSGGWPLSKRFGSRANTPFDPPTTVSICKTKGTFTLFLQPTCPT